MRAADADRQQVAARLQAALDEGRLDLGEYDERLQRAYAAKTYGELDTLLTDLPAVPAQPGPASAVVPAEEHSTRRWLLQVWSSWVPAVAVTTAVWGATSLASGHAGYYWPVWVAGPWGAVLVWQTVAGLASGEPRRQAAQRARELAKEQARQLRRERRALGADEAPESPGQPG
ncbi:DUF1707 domain-containing protein [Krasilnikovia sp. M28-CT-15]|uniref:DUF1707 SHOCT-like domain-containing protein n=1 Tax=Krasilnikovia sp. M28-CT-15 TaxID=3373540 RepID=UPI00399D1C16